MDDFHWIKFFWLRIDLGLTPITTGGKGSAKECYGLQDAFWIKTKRSGGVVKSFHGSQDHAREHAPDCIRMRWDESSNSGPKAERIIVSDGETCPFCSTREDVHSSESWTWPVSPSPWCRTRPPIVKILWPMWSGWCNYRVSLRSVTYYK